jgi:cardiolipin synthase
MNYVLLLELIYVGIIAAVCLIIIYDTDQAPKTLAYLLFTIFVPVVGVIFYLFFGINLRKRKLFEKKMLADEATMDAWHRRIVQQANEKLESMDPALQFAQPLIHLLLNDGYNPLTYANRVELLYNGEEKMPDLLKALQTARHHIHLEYYIIEDDDTTRELQCILIQKAKEGVQVRLIYDDFGSKAIRGKFVQELRATGAEVYPFNKVRWLLWASKINYRNHRKIAVIDGVSGWVGGINLCEKYINTPGKLYWRDTHLRIDGPAVWHLQHIFLKDWNFCSNQQIGLDAGLFPNPPLHLPGTCMQMVAGGPDCPRSVIMLSMLKAINLAQRNLYITTPYFIPDISIVNALKMAALSGVDVRLLVPGISDSYTVNAAAKSYYRELLKVGIKIYLYQKGFVHAKTMVVDNTLAVVGTANMDIRSFDINFEINANMYDPHVAHQLASHFLDDIKEAEALDYETWQQRPFWKIWPERIARLLSPLL